MLLRLGDETRALDLDRDKDKAPRVRPLGPGTFAVENTDGSSETFHCVRAGDTLHLWWRGAAYVLEVARPGERKAGERGGSAGLSAPMPGKVIKISVVPGQAVRKGDEILVIEAMKMENAVRAARDGVVKSIAVRVGEMADAAVPLAELE
jgi:3-methylcrotonyl-CoA carboxylase alpha subunit